MKRQKNNNFMTAYRTSQLKGKAKEPNFPNAHIIFIFVV